MIPIVEKLREIAAEIDEDGEGEENLPAEAVEIIEALVETLEFAANALRVADFLESAEVCERALARARGAA